MNETREKVATYLDDYLYDVRSYDAKNVYEAADDIIELIDKEQSLALFKAQDVACKGKGSAFSKGG
jgi:hypothetical protein